MYACMHVCDRLGQPGWRTREGHIRKGSTHHPTTWWSFSRMILVNVLFLPPPPSSHSPVIARTLFSLNAVATGKNRARTVWGTQPTTKSWLGTAQPTVDTAVMGSVARGTQLAKQRHFRGASQSREPRPPRAPVGNTAPTPGRPSDSAGSSAEGS